MATRTPKTPPVIHPAFDVTPTPEPVPVATPPPEGVADRGNESGVAFFTDGAGRRFVASGHADAGKPW
tara:strand:- start:641 stop:844 length:204 start_codon:yes stop_codon:yes gene_type:complete